MRVLETMRGMRGLGRLMDVLRCLPPRFSLGAINWATPDGEPTLCRRIDDSAPQPPEVTSENH